MEIKNPMWVTSDLIFPILYFSMDGVMDRSKSVETTIKMDNSAEYTLVNATVYAVGQKYQIAYGRPELKEGGGYYGNVHSIVTKEPEYFVEGKVVTLKSTFDGNTATFTKTVALE